MGNQYDVDFDPYYRWLGIPKGKRPVNHYRLLGVSPKEIDKELIHKAAERQRSNVNAFKEESERHVSARLLYEIEEARFILLDDDFRKQYNSFLREKKKKRVWERRYQNWRKKTLKHSELPKEYIYISQSSGFVEEFAWIFSIIFVGFALMALVTFYLPWQKVVFNRNRNDEVAKQQPVNNAPPAPKPIRKRKVLDKPKKNIVEKNPPPIVIAEKKVANNPEKQPLEKSKPKAEKDNTLAEEKKPVDRKLLAIAPFDRKEAKKKQKEWASRLGVSMINTNGIGMEMNLIPPGEFTMGEKNMEFTGKRYRKFKYGHKEHRVQITKPFYMGRHEVTQGDYKKITNSNPSYRYQIYKRRRNKLEFDDYPMENINWYEAVVFCNKLSSQEGIPQYYSINNIEKNDEGVIINADITIQSRDGYRLPTEAEWEYTCRAGTMSSYHYGKTPNWKRHNFTYLRKVFVKKGGHYTKKSGSYGWNNFGLFDMHGNVSEWCYDWCNNYSSKERVEEVVKDPLGPFFGEERVHRGGSYADDEVETQSAFRHYCLPSKNNSAGTLGFRVCRTISDDSNKNSQKSE